MMELGKLTEFCGSYSSVKDSQQLFVYKQDIIERVSAGLIQAELSSDDLDRNQCKLKTIETKAI